jgi:Terminase RNaseH-like domain
MPALHWVSTAERLRVPDTRSLKAFPATPNASIETTCSHLVLDEWAHTFNPATIWSAVEPTLAPRATSALITTAGDPGDFVHDYYVRSHAGETRHTPVFVSALERPDRSPAWLEQKRVQEGKWSSLRNYPTSVEEAFAAAGQPYFDPELLKAAQRDAMAPSPVCRGDRCLKAWDIGRKRPSVCVVLQVAAEDEPDVWHVRAYERLVGEDYPTIQREIERMHRQYPGPTVVEANSVGKPVIENLRLPEGELIEFTTTKASKQQMLTAIELRLQQGTLKIHTELDQLLAELGDYRDPEGSIVQDSVMALGIAVAKRTSLTLAAQSARALWISSRSRTSGTTGTPSAASAPAKTS